jgi:hypothetical protein
MQLQTVLSFLEDNHGPVCTPLGARHKVLVYVVTLFLHIAKMGLSKVFTVVIELDVKDPVVVYTLVLEENIFCLGVSYNGRPKFMVSFASLALPLCVSPRISQFEHSHIRSIPCVELNSIDLNQQKMYQGIGMSRN